MKMNKHEKEFADLMDRQNRKWEFPVKKFVIGDTTYRPDFYLPEEDLYVEVIGSATGYIRYQKNGKLDKLRVTYPEIELVVLDYMGNPYPNKDIFKCYPLLLKESEHRLFKTRAAMRGQSIKELIIEAVYALVEKGGSK